MHGEEELNATSSSVELSLREMPFGRRLEDGAVEMAGKCGLWITRKRGVANALPRRASMRHDQPETR